MRSSAFIQKQTLIDEMARYFPARPADLGKLIADETEKWGKVVKFAGANPD
jgi:hypothetical protein